MVEVAKALGLGVVVGVVFGMAGQPVPAPGTIAGVAGVIGLFVGWAIVAKVKR